MQQQHQQQQQITTKNKKEKFKIIYLKDHIAEPHTLTVLLNCCYETLEACSLTNCRSS
jgi:hypothetical protein